jgi:hypothetical protein
VRRDTSPSGGEASFFSSLFSAFRMPVIVALNLGRCLRAC